MASHETPIPLQRSVAAECTDPRLYMAAERTFLSWIRTGIALMAFGFVVVRVGIMQQPQVAALGRTLADGVDTARSSLLVGLWLIGTGIVVCLVSAFRHRRYIQAIEGNRFGQAFNARFAFVVVILLVAIGFLLAYVLVTA